MKQFMSEIRMKMRKFKILYKIMRRIHIIIDAIIKLPMRVKIIVSDIKLLKRQAKKIDNANWIINIPNHANLGDQAMAYSERRWLKEQYPEYEVVELSREVLLIQNAYMLKLLRRAIKREDIIWCQGGYTSCDKTPNEKVHRYFAKNFSNKMVFFPQTVSYSSENEKKKTAELYNAKKNIVFLARDAVSYNNVKDYFTNIKLLLYPDIVSTMIEREKLNLADNRDGILFIIREDSEKNYDKNSILQIKNNISYLGKVVEGDLMIGKSYQTPEQFHKVIDELIEEMSSYKLIITDRFHGILFSIISNTRVIAIDSIDYKVREGVITFSNLIPGSCYYASNLEEVSAYAKQLYNEPNGTNYNTICYDKYYTKLREIVDTV